VRSHNIIFFSAEELDSPYLVGFTEARVDQSSEMSALEKGDYDLYRPYQDSASAKSADKTLPKDLYVQHDLYGLGIVLLEIGLWRTVDSLRGRKGLADLHQKLIPQYVAQLSYRTGNYYRDAVLQCLGSVREGADESRMEYVARVVEQLARCSA
jgi:hypothetical protein